MRIGVVCVIKESWGGSEELWAAMALEAIAEGHEVIVSAYNCGEVHPKMQALISKGLKLVYRRGYVKPGLPTWKRILTKGVNILVNRISNPFKSFFFHNPDLIFYVGTDYSILEDRSLVNSLSKYKSTLYINVQLASDFRQVTSMENTLFVANFFKKAETVCFVSKQNQEAIERHLAITVKNGIVVRNPVNLDDLSYVRFPENKQTQMALVGNLILAHKGQDIVLDILKEKVWLERNWHLNIYGGGMDESFLKDLIKHYKIQDRVTLHGRIKDIRKIWEKNQVLLMPSIMEGMALAVVEAMICGRATIATKVGGHSDWIEDKKEGFLAESPSKISFEKALTEAWERKELWQKMGIEAREKALKLYDPNPGRTVLRLLA